MSKNPRHRAGDPPVVENLVDAPAAQSDFVAPPAAASAMPVEPPRAGAPTDNVAIVAGLFGGADGAPDPEPYRRDEPNGSLGDLVRPMQTWPPTAEPVPEDPAPRGRRAANYDDENVFRG